MTKQTVRVSLMLAALGLAPLARAEEPAKPAQPVAPGAAQAPGGKQTAAAAGKASAAAPTAPTTSNAPATAVEARAESAAPPAAPAAPDVSALSTELSEVLDELIQARSRASVLAKSLFRTRIDINVLRRADDQQLLHVKLALDGVPVHESTGAVLAGSEAHLFSGYIAPGVHEIGVEVSEQAKENATYRYTRAERFRIETKKDTNTQVDVILRDDSDMAEELPEGDDGEYDVSTRVRVTPIKVKD